MSNDNLATCVDRGWEALTLARFLVSELSFDASCPAQAFTFGQRLTELATGFDHCNQPPAVRLVSGLAGAFTELGRSHLVLSKAVLDVIQAVIQEFGDMLVELDATGQLANSEPGRATVRWEAEAARQKTSRRNEEDSLTTPLRHGNPLSAIDSLANASSMHDIMQSGDRIFLASESLLKRLHSDDVSPYMAPVSRIHHLAETLRGQLLQLSGQTPNGTDFTSVTRSVSEGNKGQRLMSSPSLTLRVSKVSAIGQMPAGRTQREPFATEDQTEDLAVERCDHLDTPVNAEADITELFPLTLDRFPSASSATQPSVRPTRGGMNAPEIPFLQRLPQVIVVDESPFFRMLLSSAIEAAGHQSRSIDSRGIDEALSSEASGTDFTATEFTAGDIVVWSGANSPEHTTRLLDWAQARDADSTPTLIRLLDGPHESESPSPAFHRTLLRNQIPELLRAIDDQLGPHCRSSHVVANSAR